MLGKIGGIIGVIGMLSTIGFMLLGALIYNAGEEYKLCRIIGVIFWVLASISGVTMLVGLGICLSYLIWY